MAGQYCGTLNQKSSTPVLRWILHQRPPDVSNGYIFILIFRAIGLPPVYLTMIHRLMSVPPNWTIFKEELLFIKDPARQNCVPIYIDRTGQRGHESEAFNSYSALDSPHHSPPDVPNGYIFHFKVFYRTDWLNFCVITCISQRTKPQFPFDLEGSYV